MANKKISELNAASDLTGFEFAGIQGGVSKRAALALLSALFQPSDATLTTLAALTDDQLENLTALAGLDDDAGLLEQTGDGAFTQRAIGIAASTDIPTRAHTDARAALVVATLADLRALTSTTYSGSYVRTISYHSSGTYADGFIKGGGLYRYDSTDTTTADNGSTVIVDATAGTARRWKLVHDGTIHASQCGCCVDGTTDDLTALNRGIALLNSATSGVRCLISDPGDLALSDTPSALTRTGRSILGYGLDVSEWKMLSSAGTNGTFLQIGDTGDRANRITISNLSFINDNNATLTGGEAAIWFKNCLTVSVTNCHFADCNTVFRYGGTEDGNAAIRVMVSNCHGQPTTYDGAHLFLFQAAAGCNMTNCFWSDQSTSVTNSRIVAVIPAAKDVSDNDKGIDGIQFTNVIWNCNRTDRDYGFVFDATEPGIGNVRFSNCVMDGGLQYAILFRIGSTATSANARIYNCSIKGCRISASTSHASSEGGGGIHIDHEYDNYIHGIVIDGNVFSIGSKRGIYHERAGGVDLNATGMVISNNTFANSYTNADTLGTTRDVIEINGNGFVITGNRVGSATEAIDDAVGANFFNAFVKIGSSGAQNNVIDGNDVTRTNDVYPVNVDALSASSIANGPKISNNSGKPEGPIRTIQTTDATETSLATQSLTDGCTYEVSGTVIGVKSDDGDRAIYTFSATASATGGAATLHSGGTVTALYESDAAWACAVDASAASIRIRVTGKAATTINWGLYDVRVKVRT